MASVNFYKGLKDMDSYYVSLAVASFGIGFPFVCLYTAISFYKKHYFVIKCAQGMSILFPYIVNGPWKKFAKQRWEVVSCEHAKTLVTVEDVDNFLLYKDFLDSEAVKEAMRLKRSLLLQGIHSAESENEIIALLENSKYKKDIREILLKKLRRIIREYVDCAQGLDDLSHPKKLIDRYCSATNCDFLRMMSEKPVFGFTNAENTKLEQFYCRQYSKFLLNEVLSAKTGIERCFRCRFPARYAKFARFMKVKQNILSLIESCQGLEKECRLVVARADKILKRAVDSFGK